jgi:hypothetical protein
MTGAVSPKFKIGDTVVCTDRPFELFEIIKQLPESGERQYRINPLPFLRVGLVDDLAKCLYRESLPPPIRSRDGEVIRDSENRQRDFCEKKLKDSEKVLDELLDSAKAKKDHANRNALLFALMLARRAYDERTKKPLPADPVKRLKESIQKTSDLFAELMTTNHGFPNGFLCKIGGGIVEAMPLPREIPVLIPGQTQALKIWDSEEIARANQGTAIVNLPNLLKAWHSAIEKLPTKKREGQPKRYKDAICEEAIRFLDDHSTVRRTNAAEFVEKFYERVTGTPTEIGSLEHQIKKANKIRKAKAKNVRKTRD